MGEIKTSVRRGGSVVLPSKFRKALGVDVGDEVILTLEDDGLRITTAAMAVKRSQLLVKRYIKPARSLSKELLNNAVAVRTQ